MRTIVLCAVAFLLALVQASTLNRWVAGPDLPLAFVIWSMVAGRRDDLVLRTWLLGLTIDLIVADAAGYHLILCFGAALLFHPVKPFLYHDRVVSWIFGGMFVLVWQHLCHGLWFGWFPPFNAGLVAAWINTIAATIVIGWLSRAVPERLHPLGRLSA